MPIILSIKIIDIIFSCVLLVGWCIGWIIAERKHDYLIVFQVYCENKDTQTVGNAIYSLKKSELNISSIGQMEKAITKELQDNSYVDNITRVIITNVIKLN